MRTYKFLDTKRGAIELRDAECPTDGGKYELMCMAHGCFIQDTNKQRLWGWAKHSIEWCGSCREQEKRESN